MASIQEMLAAGNGSFSKAETIALQKITNGERAVWLDLALLLSVQGQFTGARQAQTKYFEHFPNCPRVRFGMAPFALSDGDLQSGLQLLEFGRQIDCWGGVEWKKFNIPVWDGTKDISGKTLLIHGEGGIGDEVLSLRSTIWAKERGAKCIFLASSDLMKVADKSLDAVVVGPGSAHLIQADYWIPAMSAPRLFSRTWDDLWPGQYIINANENLDKSWKKIIPKVDGKLNVGIRWQGNPQFEHEQLRRFDPEFIFRATKNDHVIRWSLQKETDTTLPEDVNDLEPFLTSWEHTIAAMSQLDLVITSCTSIAHVAAAMNIPTWVVVPVMPYYCWARPGPKTDWYPAVTVYRQEKYDDWNAPFKQIKHDLKELADHKSNS